MVNNNHLKLLVLLIKHEILVWSIDTGMCPRMVDDWDGSSTLELFSSNFTVPKSPSSLILLMWRLGPDAEILWSNDIEISRPPSLVHEYLVMSGLPFALIVKLLELFTSKLISFIASMNCGLSENRSHIFLHFCK